MVGQLFKFWVIILFISACDRHNQHLGGTEELPNIIVILADDMGYGDISCYNPKSLIPSPNMDQLAVEGIRFTDAHSPSSVCTPSRYGLLTGRYCWRTRLTKGVLLGYDETPLIDKERMTLATLLKQKNYISACIGKWHLGLDWQTKNGYVLRNDSNKWNSDITRLNEMNIDFTKSVNGGPRELGFDYFFGTLGCSTGDPPYCFIENDKTVGIPSIFSPAEMNNQPGVVKGLMVPDWSQEEVDVRFTQKATEFIEDTQKDTKNPFFLYLALSSPHIPFLPPDFAQGKSEEGPRGDLVTVVDWSVGKIVETLEQYNLSEHTLLIVTSDNGPRKGANEHQSAGSFRGYKGSIWEGGHRVPFIAKWPGHIKAGTTSDQVISLTDLFSTLASLTKVNKEVIKDGGEDSHNVLPAFLGQSIEGAETQVRIFHSTSGTFALRKGKWKLIEGKISERNPETADTAMELGELYDLATDPYEENNLWKGHPEIVIELTKLLSTCKKAKSIANL